MIGILASKPDSCQAACVASILEVPLDKVPDDYTKSWDERLHMLDSWLWTIGYHMICIGTIDKEDQLTIPCYYMASVVNPRTTDFHCVVCQNGKVIWDPSPSRNIPHDNFCDFTFFVPLDPARELAAKLANEPRFDWRNQ